VPIGFFFCHLSNFFGYIAELGSGDVSGSGGGVGVLNFCERKDKQDRHGGVDYLNGSKAEWRNV